MVCLNTNGQLFYKIVFMIQLPEKNEEKMKLISWNVNGIRASIKKGFYDFVEKHDPDVLCVQETKAQSDNVDLELPQYQQIWNSALRKGYSGTLVLTKKKPLSIILGMGKKEYDDEGRVIAVEYEDFFLLTVYTPNSKRGLERLGYRQEWDSVFLKHLKKLEKKKPVVFCGDLNVAHKEIDLTYPKANVKNHGFTPEERAGFDAIIKNGFLDCFRVFNQEGQNYTWWSQMHRARERNIGWRIDYFCVSESLKSSLKSAAILSDVMGSDHCPVQIILNKK
jgi:exodeoxyribonuclease-3